MGLLSLRPEAEPAVRLLVLPRTVSLNTSRRASDWNICLALCILCRLSLGIHNHGTINSIFEFDGIQISGIVEFRA